MARKDKTDDELVESAGSAFSPVAQGDQAEMMRRLKNSIERFDKNTVRYSKALTALTLILIVVALVQLVVSIALSNINPWIEVFIEIIALGIILYAVIKISKDFH